MDFTEKYRPKKIEEIIGQKHLFSENSVLRKLIEKNKLTHSFFYGPPGTGKTSVAKIIAQTLNRKFHLLDGANFKINEIRKISEKKNLLHHPPLVFIDEIQRLTKNQQEALLVPMERNDFILIGAGTENPFYSITKALRSRSLLFEFKPLEIKDLLLLLNKVAQNENLKISDKTKKLIAEISEGDARSMLNLLEAASCISNEINTEIISSLKGRKIKNNLNSSYDLMSAFIKSLRGSDIDASLYYLALLINSGIPPEQISRRLLIFSSEDIGNANPNALNISVNTLLSVKETGYPEAEIILSQCVIYLASSPKSNSSYLAIKEALSYIENNHEIPKVPEYLKLNSPNYKNPHEQNNNQKYMLKKVKFYNNKNIGFEKTLNEWIKKIKSR